MKRIFFLSVLALIIAVCLFFHPRDSRKHLYTKLDENTYRFGRIKVDKSKGTIEFSGKVVRASGHVDFLLYLEGYMWLKNRCAIVSDAKLYDLQNAIAFINWKLWDELWAEGRLVSEKMPEMSLRCSNKERKPQDLTDVRGEALGLGDFVFLGSPYFDQIVLRGETVADCNKCPAYRLEEKTLRKKFIRKSGKSGYNLNPANIPPEGKGVAVTIKCQLR